MMEDGESEGQRSTRMKRALEDLVALASAPRERTESTLDAMAFTVGLALAADWVTVHSLAEGVHSERPSAQWLSAESGALPAHFPELLGRAVSASFRGGRSHPVESQRTSALRRLDPVNAINAIDAVDADLPHHESLGIKSHLWQPFSGASASGRMHVLAVNWRASERTFCPDERQFALAAARLVSVVIEQRKAVDDMARAQAAVLGLQRLESIRVLTAGAAHDLASLMSGIRWAVERAREQLADAHPAANCLDDIAGASGKSIELLRELRAVLRDGRHRVEALSLATLTAELVPLLQSITGYPIQLTIEDPAIVEADANQLRQILINLVSNAAESMDHGGDGSSVRIRLARAEDSHSQPAIVLEVTDAGDGIEPGWARRIFEPFATTRGPGRGLGLSAVARICRELGGEVLVDSTVGVGSTFRVLLPLPET